jgi:hypothetical protein
MFKTRPRPIQFFPRPPGYARRAFFLGKILGLQQRKMNRRKRRQRRKTLLIPWLHARSERAKTRAETQRRRDDKKTETRISDYCSSSAALRLCANFSRISPTAPAGWPLNFRGQTASARRRG